MKKKLLSLLLVLCMLCSLLPAMVSTGFAADYGTWRIEDGNFVWSPETETEAIPDMESGEEADGDALHFAEPETDAEGEPPATRSYYSANSLGSYGSDWIMDEYGVMYSSDMKVLMSVPRSIQGSYTIPEGVEEIAGGAFSGCRQLTAVTISDSVRHIGAYAFNDCRKMDSLVIGSGVEVMEYGAFNDCYGLHKVYIDDLAAWCSIEFGMNEDCDNSYCYPTVTNPLYYAGSLYVDGMRITDLVIPDGVEHIPDGAFFGCDILSSVSFPASVKSVGESAFNRCDGIKKVYAEDLASWCEIDFAENYYGFHGADIDHYMYMISNPLYYADELIVNDEVVRDLVIPEGVERIGNSAFYAYKGLNSVVISDGVKEIGDHAFSDCSALNEVRIGAGVEAFGEGVFSYCEKQNITMELSENNPNLVIDEYGVLFSKDKSKLFFSTQNLDGSYRIPEGVTDIFGFAFEGCYELNAVSMPSSVKRVGKSAFSGIGTLSALYIDDLAAWCGIDFADNMRHEYGEYDNTISNPLIYAERVYVNGIPTTELVIPAGVEYIGNYAFHGFKELKSVTIPDSVQYIGEGAFSSCSSITNVSIDDLVAWCNIEFADNHFIDCYNWKYYIISNPLYYADKLYVDGALVSELVIPDGVEYVSAEAFYGFSGLKSITIPDSVKRIGDSAFYGCTNLSSVYAEDLISWLNIEFSSSESNPCYNAQYFFVGGELVNELVIPDGIEHIGDYAFYGCKGLSAVTVPCSVKSIGTDAFYGCPNISSVYIDDLAAWCDIEFGAEYSNPLCQDIYYHYGGECKIRDLYVDGVLTTELTLPAGTSHIRDYAFCGLGSVTKVTLPEGVTHIGKMAFFESKGLREISIPGSLQSIGESAFDSCTGLQSVYIQDLAKWCEIEFADSFSNPLCVNNEYYGEMPYGAHNLYVGGTLTTELVIPEGTSRIGDYAFCGFRSTTEVSIPNSVTDIGAYSFAWCDNLREVSIPGSVRSIGNEAFLNCVDLINVTIPGSVHRIGNEAFRACTALSVVNLEEGVTHIGNLAFADCSRLTAIKIPDSVTSLGTFAFLGCNWLTRIEVGSGVAQLEHISLGDLVSLRDVIVSEDNPHYYVDEYGVLYNEDMTVIIKCLWGLTGTYTVPDSVQKITAYAFNGCEASEVILPDGIETIDKYAFADCTSLVDISLPNNLVTIGEYAFAGCTGLKELALPESEIFIREGAFSGCTGLYSMYIPDNVKAIGKYAFSDCSNLTELTLDCGEAEIANYSFENCASLERVIIGETFSSFDLGEIFGYSEVNPSLNITINGNTEIYTYGDEYTLTIGEKVSELRLEQMYRCTHIKVDPENPYFSDDGAGNLFNKDKTELIRYKARYSDSYAIPEGVESIADKAFDNMRNLYSISIPDSVVYIGEDAFARCYNLSNVYINDLSAWCEIEFESADSNPLSCAENLYVDDVLLSNDLVLPEGITEIKGYAFYGYSKLTDVLIPEGVTTIGDSAFYNCSSLVSVTIPKGVTTIGKSAFCYCSKLTDVSIPEGVTSIGDSAFYNCSSLVSVTIPKGVTTIGDSAFYYCSKLTDVSIPEGVTSIGDYAFCDCSSLVSVTIPKGVTTIGKSAFYNCSKMTDVSIPEGVTSIGDSAFYNCSKLTDVSIPEGVTSIGDSAFYYCSKLTDVSIPEGVTSIGDSAFSNCSSLVSVTIPEGVTSIGNSAFSNCSSLASVTLPKSVTSIGDSAFYYCNRLNGVYISDLSSWCDISFGDEYSNPLYYAGKLYLDGSVVTDLVLAEDTVRISAYALAGYTGLESVSLSGRVIEVGEGALPNTTDLFLTIGAETEYVSETLFAHPGLVEVELDPENAYYSVDESGVLFSKDQTLLLRCPVDFAGRYEIPDGVIRVCDYAFYSCEGLVDIFIPDNVADIGNYAFSYCKGLESLCVGNGVTYVGDSAFAGSNPYSISASAGKCANNIFGALLGADYRVGVPIEADGICYLVVENGAYFNKDKTTLFRCPSSFSGNFVIPDGVTVIYDSAFYNCSNLTGVTIPNSVTTIGDRAFYGCSNLRSIVIPDGVSRIGARTFVNCKGLSEICIPDSVTAIGENAFAGCSKLTSVIIGSGVKYIGVDAFVNCTCISEVHIKDVAAWCDIDFECDTDSSGYCESCYSNPLAYANDLYIDGILTQEIVIPEGVERISAHAFYDFDGLHAITIPASVQCFEECVFYGCFNYDVYISDIAAWCNIEFEYSQYPTDVDDTNPLAHADELYIDGVLTRDIVIPDGVERISANAFYGFDGFDTITIPASVQYFGENAFRGCQNCGVCISDIAAWCSAEFANGESNPLEGSALYIDGVLAEDITIPSAVQCISPYAFYGCTNLNSVVLSEGVAAVGDFAFYCSEIHRIDIPSTIKSFGIESFGNCYPLADVHISDLAAWCDTEFSGSGSNPLTSADNLYVNGIATTHLVIPEKVERIEDYAFCGCSFVTALTIPTNVKSIGAGAFHYCENLKDLYINDLDLWLEMDFVESYSTVNYEFLVSDPMEIAENVYVNGVLTTELVIPEGTTHIKDYAYRNYKWVSSVVIPDSVICIGDSAFSGCSNLTHVKIGEGIRGIGYDAFANCPALETVSFMGDIHIVDYNAFPDSTELSHAHFLSDMPVIKKWAFGCEEVIEDNGDDSYEDDYYEEEENGTGQFVPSDTVLRHPLLKKYWETSIYNAEPYTYINNGPDHTLDCPDCDFAHIEEHTFVNGVCICGAKWDPIDEPQLIFSSKTLSLRDYICFDFTVHNSVLEHYDSWFVIFERYDHELDTIVTTRVESEDFFNHQLLEIKLCSYQMADPFTATLYAVKDGTPYRGEVYTNSVAGYVNENIVNATSDAHRTLFANLVTYGAKAQIYMNYNTENLADAGLGEYASYVTTTIPTAETVFSETNNGRKGVTLTRTALGIASAVELQFALNVSDEYNANKIYAEMVYTGSNGQTVTERVEGSDFLDYGIFYVCIFRSLTAVDGRTPVEVTVYDQSGNAISETWTYSIASYLDGSPLTGTALDTLHALINYFDAAEVYFSEIAA